jgi:hypothetical protein
MKDKFRPGDWDYGNDAEEASCGRRGQWIKWKNSWKYEQDS